nr:MAG TPA: hypothetical protein [Caudoviricetes sp.]DAY84127.1 MAG TPA: hypothetical protein [Caudoviricetes sp.]
MYLLCNLFSVSLDFYFRAKKNYQHNASSLSFL